MAARIHVARERPSGRPRRTRSALPAHGTALLALQRLVGNQAVLGLLMRGEAGQAPATVQREIVIANERVTSHTLWQKVDLENSALATRHLRPIAQEWLRGGTHEAASGPALRTQLVVELTNRWVEEIGASAPRLRAFLTPNQFHTLVYMAKLTNRFDLARLESALSAVQRAAHVAQDTVAEAIGPGKLPEFAPNFGIFGEDWGARVPGVMGLAAEFESAASVDPKGLSRGQKVRLSQDFQLGGAIGGQTTQDADVSFVEIGGHKVLVEVAATVDRLRDKMGTAGVGQRQRYQRVAERNANAVLAYSVPGAQWLGFFNGDAGTSIAERLPNLDNAHWGLLLDGRYVAPAELLATAQVVRFAEPRVPGFWEALQAAQLGYAAVAAMEGQGLADRLQRNARRR
jgi:hypothetical protein